MYLADYHTHSRISPDAGCSMADMARAAVEKGLQEICFTDHVEPITWGENVLRPLPYDWAPLKEEFARAQEELGDKIRLRLGIELGDAVQDFAHTAKILENAPEFDFIIGSIHMLSADMGGKDLYFFDPKDEETARRGIRDYLKRVQCLAEWDGKFSVLGHLTLPLRYLNENRGFDLTFDGYEAEVESILRTLIAKGRGIEINTNRGNAPLPGEKWLRMYRELGGRIITLGSDAHTAENASVNFASAMEFLKAEGFAGIYLYRNRNPLICTFKN